MVGLHENDVMEGNKMNDTERNALKAELKAEIMAEMQNAANAHRAVNSARFLQPVLDKWCHGENKSEHDGPMFEALPIYKGWDTYDHIRRITCNIMNVSRLQHVHDVERARHIADRLCEVVTELAKEGEHG